MLFYTDSLFKWKNVNTCARRNEPGKRKEVRFLFLKNDADGMIMIRAKEKDEKKEKPDSNLVSFSFCCVRIHR